MNESEKKEIIEKLRRSEEKSVKDSKIDSFQVTEGTKQFGSFAEDDPDTHKAFFIKKDN
jgi:hypothetical protein